MLFHICDTRGASPLEHQHSTSTKTIITIITVCVCVCKSRCMFVLYAQEFFCCPLVMK